MYHNRNIKAVPTNNHEINVSSENAVFPQIVLIKFNSRLKVRNCTRAGISRAVPAHLGVSARIITPRFSSHLIVPALVKLLRRILLSVSKFASSTETEIK